MKYFTKTANIARLGGRFIKGLKMHRSPSSGNTMGYYAELNGKYAGELHIEKPGNYASMMKVPEKMRRKGIAQALTENAMAREGALLPDPGMISKDGSAFWAKMQERHGNYKGSGIQLAYKPHSYLV